jgi:hypothetical protein
VGRASAMVRSLCELEWGKGERRRWVHLARRRASNGALKKRKEGVWYGDEGENRESTWVPRSEGRTVRQDEASAAQRCGHARAAHVGPTTDGVCRARSDSDPTCAA